MASRHQQTSLITILSSEHGRMRREQRDINMRSLQKAIKHGTRERCWGGRWKIEYDGIIFISDDSLRREVTAFPSPLSFAEIDDDALAAHDKARRVLELKPELCNSHTVLVVDNSGSMSTHDINLHRDRQTAAYTVTALEFVAEQLFNGTANNSDVVSLVEFSNKAKVVFTREPVSWVLYNQLLARRDSRNFQARESAKMAEYYRCDSNYLPALDAAEELLSKGFHDACALSLFFLSDGAPSDARELDVTPAAANRHMCRRMQDIASKFGHQLDIAMVGFGNGFHDFATLKSMVEAVKEVSRETRAEFMYCDKVSNAIGAAVTSLVSSTTATRTMLMEGPTSRSKTERNIASEEEQVSRNWRFYRILNHFGFDPREEDFVQYPGLPPGALRESNQNEAKSRYFKPPSLLAINTHYCGKGIERLAFRAQLSVGQRPSDFVLGEMVAKETVVVERIEENVAFHRSFLETQSLASHLAKEFNSRLQALPGYGKKSTPKISFLGCSVLVLDDPEWPGGERGVLVEKMLDTHIHEWCKWNNNAGAVDGRVAHIPIDVDRELEQLYAEQSVMDLDAIEEADSAEESESDDDESLGSVEDYAREDETENSSPTNPSDYLQAFTHFTYRYTNGKVMVCDLQGVYNTDLVPPTFELTDPAIHYKSNRGREMVFGRTDKGKKGIQLFFNTHKCSGVCKLMQLSKKNKKWQKEWHRDFMHY